ncbi:MAG TPA: peptidoglycan DD-metalloendopeptidase family protein [Anaeromyxobacteraceae bacterium]|nr:peptidoglycan DD-metalloendopeptidase family protein [Anaeromyxobacteraceae bacterium]
MHCLALPLVLALAASPVATFRPPTARPGDPVVLEVRGARSEPRGELAGRALEFHPARPGVWRAIAALPLEQLAGPIDVPLRAGADAPEPACTARLEVVPPGFRETRLAVPPRFVEPRPAAVEAQVAEDRAAFLAAFAQPPTPPLFSKAFRAPRSSAVTGRFGDLRTFNGETQGQHYGTDFKGRVGDPVLAANDGRVTLVRDAWTSGLSVVVFHGAGVHSVYFHLSKSLVREGDVVKRGQRIGRVGASGRASGPHLHWGVRIGDLYVDPEAVLRLKLGSGS